MEMKALQGKLAPAVCLSGWEGSGNQHRLASGWQGAPALALPQLLWGQTAP
jgi:hypothetical protein